MSYRANPSITDKRAAWLRDSGWCDWGWGDAPPETAAAPRRADWSNSWWGDEQQQPLHAREDANGHDCDIMANDAPATTAAVSGFADAPAPWRPNPSLPSSTAPLPKFQPLTRKSKPTGGGGGGEEGGATGSSLASGATQGAAASSNSIAAVASPASSAATAPLPPLLRPVRFIKAKQMLGTEEEEVSAKSLVAASTAAAPPDVHKSAGRVLLLARGVTGAASSATAAQTAVDAAAKSVKHAPSLLTVKKAAAPSAGVASNSSTSSLFLSAVWTCGYRLAGRRKQRHRDGYLHLFRAALTTPSCAMTVAADKPIDVASSSEKQAARPYLKAQLYSERGVLLDEQLGRSVTQPDPPPTVGAQKRSREEGDGWCGGLWDTHEHAEIGRKRKRRRRGDEAESASESSDSDTAATVPALDNVFAEGERVLLGRFECELDETISQAEFERHTKITSGELSASPLPRSSMRSSCLILGPPLPPDNKGFALLAAHGGGVPERICEPVALTWRSRDSATHGIGYKEPLRPPRQQQTRREHSSWGGGRRGAF